MNTYFVPTTAPYTYDTCMSYDPFNRNEYYNHIIMVYATTPKEAYQKAREKLISLCYPKELSEYEYYQTKLYIPNNEDSYPFPTSEKYDILYKSFKHTKGFEYMAYFQVNWNNYTEQLAEKAIAENWSNKTYPNNGILANYLVKTYDKLTSEKNIMIGKDYALFNTGLFTKYHDPIYAYQSGKEIQFLTGYELGGIGVTERPERANYFENPELLLFDWHYKIDVHYPHILEDKENQKRIPKEVLESKNIVNNFDGAINKMKKKVSANYKLAVPQYFEGKIQLLLPLCLADDNIPDMALVVTKVSNVYRGHTCLTLDMAYNNARLIAKPEGNWLSQ